MTNLLAQAINCDDADRAAKMIQDALGIESDDVVNYCFPKDCPADREQRARYIGECSSGETSLGRLRICYGRKRGKAAQMMGFSVVNDEADEDDDLSYEVSDEAMEAAAEGNAMAQTVTVFYLCSTIQWCPG
jgi:hypothetical protein